MKVNVNYEVAHAAIEKLRNREDLEDEDIRVLDVLLHATIGDLIPTKEELETQRINVNLLSSLEPGDRRFKHVMDECTEFENKYC